VAVAFAVGETEKITRHVEARDMTPPVRQEPDRPERTGDDLEHVLRRIAFLDQGLALAADYRCPHAVELGRRAFGGQYCGHGSQIGGPTGGHFGHGGLAHFQFVSRYPDRESDCHVAASPLLSVDHEEKVGWAMAA